MCSVSDLVWGSLGFRDSGCWLGFLWDRKLLPGFHRAGLFSGVQDPSLSSGVQSSGLASGMTAGFCQRCQSGYGHYT